MIGDRATLRRALSFFERSLEADDARTAIVGLLGSATPPRELIDRIADAFSAVNHDLPSRETEERGENIIWYDNQLSPQQRDLLNALTFLDHGFTYRRGQQKRGRGLTSREDAECRKAMTRLLALETQPSALLMSLAAVFSTAGPGGNSEGWLVLNEKGLLELRHRRRGRNSALLDDIEVAVRVREQKKRAPNESEASAIKAVATAIRRQAGTVKTSLARGKRHLASD